MFNGLRCSFQMSPNYEILKSHFPLVKDIIDFFTSPVTAPELYRNIKLMCGNNEPLLSNKSNHDYIMNFGYFYKETFVVYMQKIQRSGKGIPSTVIDRTLQLLSNNHIISRSEYRRIITEVRI